MHALALPAVLPVERPAAGEFIKDLLSGLVYAVTHAVSIRDALCTTVTDAINVGGAGSLVFQTAASAEVATCTFSATAFGAPSSGTATANAITDDTNATGGITDRFAARSGTPADVFFGSVGLSGQDINLSSVDIGAGDTVSMTSLTYTAPL